MRCKRALSAVLSVAAALVATVGCGTFLSLSGDDPPPAPSAREDAASPSDSSRIEGSTPEAAGGDASDAGSDGVVPPRSVTCDRGSECTKSCCVKGLNDLRCLIPNDFPASGCALEVHCDQTSDCDPGKKCWLQNNPRKTACNPSAPGPNAVVVCKTDADCGGTPGSCRAETCDDYAIGTCGGGCAIP